MTRSSGLRRLAVVGAGLLLAANGALAAPFSAELQMSNPQGVTIRVMSCFQYPPPAGCAPVRIVIRNGDRTAHQWNIRFDSRENMWMDERGCSSEVSVEVKAGEEKTVDAVVPLLSPFNSYVEPGLRIGCRGPAATDGEHTWQSPGGTADAAFFAMSQSLATMAWGTMDTEWTASRSGSSTPSYGRSGVPGTPFDPAMAPSDFLGWTGCSVVMLGPSDWTTMTSPARQALCDWVAAGGHLLLCSLDGTMPAGPKTGVVGLGRISRVSASRVADFVTKAIAEIRDIPDGLRKNLSDSYHRGFWSMANLVPAIVISSGLIVLFVIGFAVLVGPVNFIVLARKRRHMHLFWTTPAISLLAGLLLFAMIALQDGFGGKGHRFTLAYLDPDAHKAVVLQEQVSRTGVLLSSSFPRTQDAFITDVAMESSDAQRSRRMDVASDTLSGDWFASRSVRGQHIRASIPTRARIEIAPGTPPVVVSAIPTTLKTIYYRDVGQRIWKATGVHTGTRVAMTPELDASAAGNWWLGRLRLAGGATRKDLIDVNSALPPDSFIAEADGPTEHVIPTLKAIDWEQDAMLYFGPVVTSGTGAAP